MGCRMHARSLASFSSADSVANKFCLLLLAAVELSQALIDDKLCLTLSSYPLKPQF